MPSHYYKTSLTWTGNTGAGTQTYNSYSRNHATTVEGKPTIPGSSDPSFRGDGTRYNPEELLVASLSSCHMLWFLHLCSTVGIIVTAYEDNATGTMEEDADGSGRFKEVVLHPVVTITDAARIPELEQLHHEAHQKCFIANSVNFLVRCEAEGNVG